MAPSVWNVLDARARSEIRSSAPVRHALARQLCQQDGALLTGLHAIHAGMPPPALEGGLCAFGAGVIGQLARKDRARSADLCPSSVAAAHEIMHR